MKKFFTLQNYCFLDTYTSTQNSHFLVAHIAVIRYTQAPKKNTPHTMRDNRRKEGNALTEAAHTEHRGMKRSKKKSIVQRCQIGDIWREMKRQ